MEAPLGIGVEVLDLPHQLVTGIKGKEPMIGVRQERKGKERRGKAKHIRRQRR